MQRNETKSEIRKRCLKKLRAIPRIRRYRQDKAIAKKVCETIRAYRSKTILFYIPLETEANLFSLIGKLRREGFRLYVPYMQEESFDAVPFRLPLRRKRFGIKEPPFSTAVAKRIDMAIVPVVGIDGVCGRIGFGKGMYDRFYARYKGRIAVTVAVSRILCFSELRVTDDYDVKADIVITA